VEVLRGPQGTLYGRNSNGGAIKLVSKKPSTEETNYEIGATIGSESRIDGRFVANWAVSDATAIRASLLTRNQDGFHTLNPNGDFAGMGRRIGDAKTLGARVALQTTFNDRWSLGMAFDRTEDDSDPIPDSALPGQDADNNIFTIEPLPGNTCSAMTPGNFQGMGCFLGYASNVETQGLSATLTGEFDKFTFRSLTGFRSMEDRLASRIGFVYLQHTDQDQLSQEFTLTSNGDGPFNWVTGLYFFEEDSRLDSTFVFDFTVQNDTSAVAAFVHGSYAATERLTLTGGLRYTSEDRDVVSSNVTFETGDGTWSATRNLSNDKATYVVSADYQVSDSVMVYGSYSTGFKSGGVSPDCFSPTACFLDVDEEEVGTIELGMRSDFMDDRVRLNLTYFNNQYDGLQIGATVPGLGFTRFNVDETEIQGFEFESVLLLGENFRVNATAGWLDGEYTQVTPQQAGGLTNDGVPCPGGIATVECAKGLSLKNAPEFRGSIGAVLAVPMADGTLNIGADIAFQDDAWSLVANSPDHALVKVDTLVNARVAYAPTDEKWQVALWGKNVTDETYYRAAAAGSFTTYASPPLTWGVDARIRF
jgi:iron complex outermembrane receptor protein